MKVNVPLTPEQHAQADAEYERVAVNQKKFIRDMADKLESGEKLDSFESAVIAAVLRGAAEGINTQRTRPPGKPAKMPGEICLLFALKTLFQGVSENAAIEALAEEYEVSTTAVKKRLGKAGMGIEREIARQELQKTIAWLKRLKVKET